MTYTTDTLCFINNRKARYGIHYARRDADCFMFACW